jgi:DNA-binding MarR family transcriptional regulator
MRDIRVRDSVPNAVVRLFRQINRLHHRTLKPLGLTAVHAHILVILWTEGPMTIGELQTILRVGSSTLTGAIDRMEKSELLRRVPQPGDRRAFRLEPAEWTDKRKNALLATLDEIQDECLAGLTKTERKTLLRLLTKVTTALDENPNA